MERTNDQRLTEMESAIMHLQHDVDSLSETLLHQQKVIDELNKSVEKLTSTIESMDGEEQRDPQQERPPHY
jgi:uncharacterized coiled-coil protein SlyX